MTERKRVFSGIQNTGEIHIGNYLGALRNWVKLQDTYDAVYCVVDLHSITIPFEPEALQQSRLETAKALLAAGIDPDRSLLYYQSQVPQHPELAWIIGVDTPMGALNRMTQFKEKSDRAGQRYGLFAYPVLMAADILLHKVHAVPVGDDQTQHLEFTRDVAVRFNGRYGDTFPVPEQITPEVGARIMSLQDPVNKMSKSDPDASSRILVFDDPDTIVKKCRRAVTDSGAEIYYDTAEKPGISNLLEILAIFTERSIDDLVNEYGSVQYGVFKQVVADAIVDGLAPIRSAYLALDDGEVKRIMAKGMLDARMRAEETMVEVRRRIGLAG